MVALVITPSHQEMYIDLWVQDKSTEQVPGQWSLASKSTWKSEAGDGVITWGGPCNKMRRTVFQPQQAAELGSFDHVILALKSRTEETTGTIDACYLELKNYQWWRRDQSHEGETSEKSFREYKQAIFQKLPRLNFML